MKQQIVVTHRYTVLKEREKIDRSIINQHVGIWCFLRKYEKQFFCGFNILTEGVF
jgi:hypothetical protein